jgi:ABC-2 type transport system ATP-binding protein
VQAAISIENVSKRFGRVWAVSQVSLQVPPGVAFGLVGPNGSGKTTLIRCCVGILKPEEGAVRISGHDLTAGDLDAKRVLGYAPELPDPVRTLTPWDHLAFLGQALELDGWQAEATRLLTVFDLLDKKDRLCLSLSKGEQQKVMLAMAFLRRPAVLFLDEPLLGLDPRAALALKREVRALLAAGGAAIISSHVLSLIEELCAALGVLSRGRLVFLGTPEGMRAAARQAPDSPLEEAFVRVTEPGGGNVSP